MKTVIRMDASDQIGTGHLIRCLTLANALRTCGSQVTFYSKDLPQTLVKKILDQGHNFFPLKNSTPENEASQMIASFKGTPDWLVTDHYGLNQRFEVQFKNVVRKILVLDDLADRDHTCDVLLDQNYYRNARERYCNRVPLGCKLLLGPEYVLLRHEFYEARRKLKARNETIRRILVFFGGVDATNETSKALRALALSNLKLDQVVIVLGRLNPHRREVESLLGSVSGARLEVDVQNMAALMAEADLSLGAGGTTTWERCFLGLPSQVIQVANNQREGMTELAQLGVIDDLGASEKVTVEFMSSRLKQLTARPDLIKSMSEKSFQLMGDLPSGNLPRVVELMLGFKQIEWEDGRLRSLCEEDLKLILEWRNSERIRSMMFNDQPISWEEHKRWFNQLSQGNEASFRVFEMKSEPVGVVQFKEIDRVKQEASWGFYLGKENLIPGIGSMMGFLGIEHGFENLRLSKIYGEVIGSNEKSIRYHKRLGFEPIESRKAPIIREGRMQQVFSFQLTAGKWKKNKTQLKGEISAHVCDVDGRGKDAR